MPKGERSGGDEERFHRRFGRGFKPEQFSQKMIPGINFDLPLYQVDPEIPKLIYDYQNDPFSGNNTFKISQGDGTRIRRGDTGFSDYAYPCLVVLTRLSDGDYHLMHVQGTGFSEEEREILEQSTGGIAGGGTMWFKEHQEILERAKIVPILPDPDELDFVLTITRRPINTNPLHKTPRGIYFAYNKLDSQLTQYIQGLI